MDWHMRDLERCRWNLGFAVVVLGGSLGDLYARVCDERRILMGDLERNGDVATVKIRRSAQLLPQRKRKDPQKADPVSYNCHSET